MRASDSPYVVDWFVISLRWLTLLGLVVSLSVAGELISAPSLILIGLAAWNLILSLLAGLNRRLAGHRQFSLGVDVLLAGAYFIFGGGYASPAFWIIFLPTITAGLYFEMRGAMLAAVLMAVIQAAVTFSQNRAPLALMMMGGSVAATLVFALVFGYLSSRLVRHLRQGRQTQQEAQQTKSRVQSERMQAIYHLTSTLTSTLNYQRVLELVLDLSLGALNSDNSTLADDQLVCAVLLFSKDEVLEVGSARRLSPADMRVVLPAREGAVAKTMETDTPILLQDVRHDPELTRFVVFQGCKEIYCFPLRSGFNAYGVLLFGHPEPGYFAPDRREILDILGSQAVIAIQNARLYQDVVDERERMIEVQEEARKKLARDLHDGPTQSVSAIAMRVNMAQRILSKDTEAAREELVRIEELARRTTKEIRHMLFTLRPLVLESQGLLAAVQSMAEKMKETFSQNVIVSIDESVLQNMEMGKQSVLFYLVEEAVNNARKHARADHIWVNLRPFEKQMAILEIRDDGAGFDVAAVNSAYDQRGSLGMVNLRERTELINGVLDLQSAPGKGTRVQVYIPLTEEAADRLHHAAANR
jgi:signal transduction histidine kinase